MCRWIVSGAEYETSTIREMILLQGQAHRLVYYTQTTYKCQLAYPNISIYVVKEMVE